MNQMSIPTSEPNDSDDVTLALETAEALWNKGDPSEALRWLRRAAEAAGDSGDDMRAVVLAKAVAELNSAGSEQSAPKPVRPPPLPPQAPSTKTEGPADESKEGLVAKGGLKGVSKAPPPPPSARKSMPPKPPSPPSIRASQAPQEKEAEPAEAKSGTQHKAVNAPAAPSPKLSVKPKAEAPKASEESKPDPKQVESAVQAATRDSSVDDEDSSVSKAQVSRSLSPPSTKAVSNRSQSATPSRAPVAVASKPAAQSSSAKRRNFPRAALRVYLSSKGQEGDKLEVHVLNDGQRPPTGAVEALLVPLRRGAKLLK